MMRCLRLVLLYGLVVSAVLVGPFPKVRAQAVSKAYFFHHFDIDSLTVTYGKFTGQNGDSYRAGRDGGGQIVTAGSSATTAALTGGTVPFALVGVGDVIYVTTAPGLTLLPFELVTAKASGDSITVDTAWDLGTTGRPFYWYKFSSGTTAADGWIDVTQLSKPFTISYEYNQGDLGAAKVIVECRANTWDVKPKTVYPDETATCGTGGTLASGYCSFATAGQDARIDLNVWANYDSCRVGVAYLTTDTSDAGANLEQFNAYITGVPRSLP